MRPTSPHRPRRDRPRRWALGLASLCCRAQLAAALPLAPTPHAHGWAWHWRAVDAQPVSLDMVDAAVVVQPAAAGIELIAVAPAAASGVRLQVERRSGRLVIRDRYPPTPAWPPAACLPPDGTHGGFAGRAVRLRVVLRVPPGVRVTARLMAGRLLDARPAIPMAGALPVPRPGCAP